MTTADPYALHGADDFVRLDGACHELLREFVDWLQQEPVSLHPAEAGALAHAADRYLREFVVDIMETGPTDADPSLVRSYLGNWYIIHTLEPTAGEMDRIVHALDLFYRFLAQRGILDGQAASRVRAQLQDREFYHGRLQAFWDLTPDTIAPWRAVDDYRRTAH
ncbi:MAG: hypothetical protein P1P84_10785 [Deferrisomatales bacterium]|nr:hypothetical protein [Deferrisomatales bacterium]